MKYAPFLLLLLSTFGCIQITKKTSQSSETVYKTTSRDSVVSTVKPIVVAPDTIVEEIQPVVEKSTLSLTKIDLNQKYNDLVRVSKSPDDQLYVIQTEYEFALYDATNDNHLFTNMSNDKIAFSGFIGNDRFVTLDEQENLKIFTISYEKYFNKYPTVLKYQYDSHLYYSIFEHNGLGYVSTQDYTLVIDQNDTIKETINFGLIKRSGEVFKLNYNKYNLIGVTNYFKSEKFTGKEFDEMSSTFEMTDNKMYFTNYNADSKLFMVDRASKKIKKTVVTNVIFSHLIHFKNKVMLVDHGLVTKMKENGQEYNTIKLYVYDDTTLNYEQTIEIEDSKSRRQTYLKLDGRILFFTTSGIYNLNSK